MIFVFLVDGSWLNWGDWSSCGVSLIIVLLNKGRHLCFLSTESKSQSTDYIVTFKVTCGTGTRRRGRVCSGSAHGGRPCDGEESQAEVCNEAPCPGFFYKKVKMKTLLFTQRGRNGFSGAAVARAVAWE